MNILKINNTLCITFSDGNTYETNNCDEEILDFLKENFNNEDIIKKHFLKDEVDLTEDVLNSEVLILRGNSVYMKGVSELSIPSDFVAKILQAEAEGNEKELTKYKNFWTLVSLNPDSRVRNNLFWFIRKWDIQISDSGLIIAYRNAELKNECILGLSNEDIKKLINQYYETKYINNIDPATIPFIEGHSLGEMYNAIINEEEFGPIYTDAHSHTTEIRLGHPVRMPREKCDADQEHSCSSGLHVGAKGWLRQNYFGDVGLKVLVNPANVVAVPTIDNYGKMRVCEYCPISLIDYDENGNVIEKLNDIKEDIMYLNSIKYDGTLNNNDLDNYEISRCNFNKESMYDMILERLSNE